MPHFGCWASSASAIRLLTLGSHPGKSIPAALRIVLRPPSHTTRYSARSEPPSDSATSTLASSCVKPRSEEHTSELQSRGLISYAVFCLKKTRSGTTVNIQGAWLYRQLIGP